MTTQKAKENKNCSHKIQNKPRSKVPVCQKNKGKKNSYTKSIFNALYYGQQPGTSSNRQLTEISKIIEQVTDFKYLRYRIAEYKSDLEDKLEKYDKINGAIRRHFRKQMNKEKKLRIHNITAKADLKFGSEAWVLRKREGLRLEGQAQMKFLRHLLGITKLDKEKNQCIH